MKRILTALLAVSLAASMAGCTKKQTETVLNAQPAPAYQVQPLEVGKLSSEPLDVAGAQLSRCAGTGRGLVAETESGYYYAFMQILYYADKEALDTWVPVCYKPTCSHNDNTCHAYVSSEFLLSQDDIYYCDSSDQYQQDSLHGEVLARMKLDGTGREIAYIVEDAMTAGGASERFVLFPDCLVACMAVLQNDGTYMGKIIRVDESGEHTLFETSLDTYSSPTGLPASTWNHIRGDAAIYSMLPDEDFTALYRASGDKLEKITSLGGMDAYGAYLSGDMLLSFVQDDGYYTTNLTTGEKAKAADCQMNGSWGVILQPNCIVETTFPVRPNSTQSGEFMMRLYNGASWRQVTLPGELSAAEEGAYLEPLALTSDRILFGLHTVSGLTCRIYQLPLNAEALELTFCAQIGG